MWPHWLAACRASCAAQLTSYKQAAADHEISRTLEDSSQTQMLIASLENAQLLYLRPEEPSPYSVHSLYFIRWYAADAAPREANPPAGMNFPVL